MPLDPCPELAATPIAAVLGLANDVAQAVAASVDGHDLAVVADDDDGPDESRPVVDPAVGNGNIAPAQDDEGHPSAADVGAVREHVVERGLHDAALALA